MYALYKTIRIRKDFREYNTMKVNEAFKSGKGLKNTKQKEGYKFLILAGAK